MEAPHSRSIINGFQALCTYSDLTFPLLSATDTIKWYRKPSVAITALANTTTEATISLCLTLRRVRKQICFLSLCLCSWHVQLLPLLTFLSYFCCIFDKHFLAAYLPPYFSIRFFTFHSPPVSRNLSPLLFALLTHFLQRLFELHNKSKFTKYFLFPLCKTRFVWAIVSLLSYFVPRWTPGSFEFSTSDIASLYPLITIAASSEACPASKALPQQPIILCGLCIQVSTWNVQGNPLLNLVFPRLWTCHIIQRVSYLASGWWMAGRHSLSGMLGLQKFYKVQIKPQYFWRMAKASNITCLNWRSDGK